MAHTDHITEPDVEWRRELIDRKGWPWYEEGVSLGTGKQATEIDPEAGWTARHASA